ncbi:hypothetical protein [Clostridium algidicarnis]|uniref:hypothetical protein n=1 Tax=Clostridium algidicarnis TaxID=37659 RepID=UPI001627C4B6|nr:hypothetical protein [Clostridium algidicarnis]MBB6696241.1 hypothetical protein [Clostridium algidicarnis]MBU3205566.1 hypothetical protein [Clostridium algidicarnis]
MLKTNKTINLTGYSSIGEVQVVYLNASISTDGASNANKSTTILNQDLYNKNKVEIRKDILEFSNEVYKVEDEIMGGTI